MQQNHHFSTTETSLAAYLIAEGFALSHIDYSSDKYNYHFTVSPNKDINYYVVQYMSDSARSNPKQLFATNKKLLRIIKRQLQWEDENG